MPSKDLKAEYKKASVASGYDARRFQSPSGRLRNRRKIAAIKKALALVDRPGLILDVPCGTGRFFEFLARSPLRFAGADISEPMLQQALAKARDFPPLGLVAADSERLPFKDASFDVLMSIRFLFHMAPETRIRVLREMSRVTKRYLILDYRLRYSLRNLSRIALSRFRLRPPLRRPTKPEMFAELSAAGLAPLAIFPVARFLSDKYIILCRKS